MPDPRDYRDIRDPRDHREREMRDPRDAMRDPRDTRDPRDMRDIREQRDMRDVRGADPRDMRGHDPRDMRERDPRDMRERDPRDPRDMRMHPHPSQQHSSSHSQQQQHHSAYPHPSHSSHHTHGSHPAHPSQHLPLSTHPNHSGHPGHPSHSSHPSHQSHPSMSHPSQHSQPPSYNPPHGYHHSSSRHSASISGPGVGMPVMGGPPPGMVMNGSSAIEQPPMLSNGHAHPLAPVSHSHGQQDHRPAAPAAPAVTPASARAKEKMDHMLGNLTNANENTWMLMGAVAEHMQDTDRAMSAFENALRHNPNSVIALTSAANIARNKDQFDKAIEYFQKVLNIKQDNGEVWGSMGHCLLMKDDLPKAYTAYQQALYHLQNPKEPKLWYGIGILYDRYGSFEHAEEAFSSVLKMDPNFEKANEIYFRLGIIYKHQRKYSASLECFRYILDNPPRPLTHFDIWFQLGHVYEQDRDYENAKSAYMRVLTHQPDHAKVLQQLGWLYHQPGAAFADQEKAVTYLTRSLETDGADAQSWYLLGRAFMAGQRYNKAYEAYQQAVYRDGRNPTFWCSIGVLYYQINQYRDALDAYSRAIRLNPYIPEVWYNLGSLYESCNNQVTDAIDAYSRATELDGTNQVIKNRLALLQGGGPKNGPLPPAPGPVDVHPSQYAATPTNGPQQQAASPRASPAALINDGRPERPPSAVRPIQPIGPPGAHGGSPSSPGPFRGGIAPPPLNNIDETRGSMSRHAPLAPMEMERPDLAPRADRGDRQPPPQASNGRHDDRAMDRRQHTSPGSPRRQFPGDGGREHGFPQYPPPPGMPHIREREREREREPRNREEWEARERRNGMGLGLAPGGLYHPHGPPLNEPRGLGVRMPVGGPHQNHKDLSHHPSPRVPSDGREYTRDPGHYNGPPQPHDDRRRYEDKVMLGAPPHPAMSRDPRLDDPRAPSPAPSNSSRASKRTRDSQGPGPVKRAKEDKNGNSGAKRTSLGGEKKKDSRKSGGGKSPAEGPKPANIGARILNEDYDEGVDALMALHGDRPSNHGSVRASSVSSTTVPAVASPEAERDETAAAQASAGLLPSTEIGNKRNDPASPHSPSTVTAKKSKSGSSSAPSPAHSHSAAPKKTIIIEVLNAENIRSPVPSANGSASRSTPVSNGPGPVPASLAAHEAEAAGAGLHQEEVSAMGSEQACSEPEVDMTSSPKEPVSHAGLGEGTAEHLAGGRPATPMEVDAALAGDVASAGPARVPGADSVSSAAAGGEVEEDVTMGDASVPQTAEASYASDISIEPTPQSDTAGATPTTGAGGEAVREEV